MKKTGFVYLTRRMVFASAHRLYHPDLDNESVYGQCVNLHGHNYTVEVTVKGKVDPQTGFLIDLRKLKQIMEEKIKKVLDHKNMNEDVKYFKNVVQSAENIAIFIWNQLKPEIRQNAELYSVRLHETENNIVEYFG